jgi:hypothetical protein
MDELSGAPEGFDHATPAQIQRNIECGECGRTVPAGDRLWLLSRGDIEAAEEVKVLCDPCGEAAGCGDLDDLKAQNGSGEP